MFFEIGTVTGGLALGLIAELLGKRAAFGAAVVAVRVRPVAAAHAASCRADRRERVVPTRRPAGVRPRRRRLTHASRVAQAPVVVSDSR